MNSSYDYFVKKSKPPRRKEYHMHRCQLSINCFNLSKNDQIRTLQFSYEKVYDKFIRTLYVGVHKSQNPNK
ncbi:hypothetical protein PN4B1_33150 [Paenibacillus naphthalenovorans]|nr:hypothetical protein PN4B1_33150 [Paenibacillus naphthalenovorans]